MSYPLWDTKVYLSPIFPNNSTTVYLNRSLREGGREKERQGEIIILLLLLLDQVFLLILTDGASQFHDCFLQSMGLIQKEGPGFNSDTLILFNINQC